MRKNLILSIVLVIIALVSSFTVRSQEILRTEDGDTLITITPRQLRTINLVFTEHDWLENKVEIQRERIKALETSGNLKDSIIQSKNNVIEWKEDLFKEQLKKELRDERNNCLVIGGVGGAIIGIIATLLILGK